MPGFKKPKAALLQTVSSRSPLPGPPRRHRHSFRGMTPPLSPSPQVGDKPSHACDPAAGLCLSSFLLFMCAWFWFQWLSSVTETTPPHHFPGPRQARADRARPGVWATVNKAAGGPLRPALPRQAPLLGGRSRGPEPPAAGARSLPGSTPEQGSLTPSSWLGVLQPQPGSLGQLGGDRGRSRPGAGAFAVASEAER